MAASLVVSAIGLASCDGGAPPVAPGTPGGIQVAGTYALVRSLLSNNCVPEIPGATAPVTGVVTQSGDRFTLRNSDTGVFDAQLQADGSFTNGKQRLVGAAGESYDLLFEGRFSSTGFRATVTVDLFRSTGTCTSSLDWQATKQGPPNFIPQ